jgi:acetyltransferase-like isoleucine patch superfamily enzyme
MHLLDILRDHVRRYRWGRDPRLSVAQSASVHPRAQIEPIEPGGSICIGEGVLIKQGVILAASGGHIRLGDGVFVGPYCVLYGHGGLDIGRGTLIAAHTVIVPMNHIFAQPDVPISQQGVTRKGIAIGEDVWIGCGARILDGVHIGDGAVIGAGAVVTKSVPAYVVALGVPAKVVGQRG